MQEEAINIAEKKYVERDVFPGFSVSRMYGNHYNGKEFAFAHYEKSDEWMGIDKRNIIDNYTSSSIKIESVEELMDAISNGKSVNATIATDMTVSDQIVVNDGQTVSLTLAPDTIISGEGSVGSNGRLFQVNNGTLKVSGGKIVTPSESYGAFRVESDGKLVLDDTTIENSKKNGLNVKVLGGYAELNNVTVNSTTGGAIEVTEASLGDNSKKGYAVLNNCSFNQSTYGDWCSTCISVSGGSKVVVNSGTYISENWALYVFSSGGEIEINNGTFVGNKDGECIRAEIDTNTYPDYTGGLSIHNGTFTGSAHITVPAYMVVDGGTFTFDPSAYVDLSKYSVVESDGRFSVEKR